MPCSIIWMVQRHDVNHKHGEENADKDASADQYVLKQLGVVLALDHDIRVEGRNATILRVLYLLLLLNHATVSKK